MNEIERLIARDRAAGAPEPPDVRYTVALLERRLGKRRSEEAQPDWIPAVGAGAMAMCLPVLVWLVGLNFWWLLAIPLSLLAVLPVLLRKGAK